MTARAEVEACLASWPPVEREMAERLRRIVMSLRPGVAESVKWNGPSFEYAGDHRITLGRDRKGGVRTVLHWGARGKASRDLRPLDQTALATWPAPDRGVVVFTSADEVDAMSEAFAALAGRWLDATVEG